MDTQRWQRVAAIFDEAIEAAADARAALIADRCGGDEQLQREVEKLVAADQRAASFDSGAESARGEVAADWLLADEETIATGECVGAWRALRELGRGGMGVVMLAERAGAGFEQRAALKLIKRGMDSDAVQSRFRRERQILARLQHPHIAYLIDGGVAADGRPYFAME